MCREAEAELLLAKLAELEAVTPYCAVMGDFNSEVRKF